MILRWECPLCGNGYISPGKCGNNLPIPCRAPLEPVYGPDAQDVIDALRLVLTQDDVDVELVRALVVEAPPTDEARGVDLLLRLIREGRLQVGMR